MDFDFGASRLVVSVNLQLFLTLAEEQQWRAALYYWYYNITVFPFCYRAPMLSAFENILNFSKFVPFDYQFISLQCKYFRSLLPRLKENVRSEITLAMKVAFLENILETRGSGCDRAIASREPAFESSHRQLILGIFLLLKVCGKEE